MKITTRFLGEREVQDEEILTFPSGLVGMKHLKRFVMLGTDKEKPLRLMQSLEDPGICVPVIEPQVFRPDYRVVVHEEALAQIGIRDKTEALVLCIVTLSRDPGTLTANLQGPLLINRQKKIGKQFILTEGQYHTRHDILKELHDISRPGKTGRQNDILEIRCHK